MGVKIQLLEVGGTDLTPLGFCLWGWMTSEVYKEKVNIRDELVSRIMNSAAIINPLNAELNLIYHFLALLGAHLFLHVSRIRVKQERQDDLRRATRTIAKRGKKCIEVDGGILENLL
jgi:hypothetical protein